MPAKRFSSEHVVREKKSTTHQELLIGIDDSSKPASEDWVPPLKIYCEFLAVDSGEV